MRSNRDADLRAERRLVEAAVDVFFDRVLADRRLRPLFRSEEMTSHRVRTKAFLAASLDGQEYRGPKTREGCAHLEISPAQFELMLSKLDATLRDLRASDVLRQRVMEVAQRARCDVLSGFVEAFSETPRTEL